MEEVRRLYEDFEISLAGEKIDELADFGNKYITKEEPWTKEKEQTEKILNNLSYLLEKVIHLYNPIIPQSASSAIQHLIARETVILFPKIESR